jgi:ABC-type polar amino acid transport system ATPase subunit
MIDEYTSPAIIFKSLSKSYGGVRVLHEVSASIPQGAAVAVLGSSGSGKSTLVRCVNRLEQIQSGEIHVGNTCITSSGVVREGRQLSERQIASFRTKIGMVFQSFNLFHHMNVIENMIEAPIGVLRWRRDDAIAKARDLLTRVGLSDKEEAFPNKLSGGQQQRIAIARSLMMEPSILLFDEPTSALDHELKEEVLLVIKELAIAGRTSMIVTHELAFAREVASHVLMLDHGRVMEFGPSEEVFTNPKSDRTKRFFQSGGL